MPFKTLNIRSVMFSIDNKLSKYLKMKSNIIMLQILIAFIAIYFASEVIFAIYFGVDNYYFVTYSTATWNTMISKESKQIIVFCAIILIVILRWLGDFHDKQPKKLEDHFL